MLNLEQVKLLDAKVLKALDYLGGLVKENTALQQQEAELQARLESCQKRIDELEALVMGFKEDQNLIENGVLAALDRFSQFEKAMEKSLRNKQSAKKMSAAVSGKAATGNSPVSGESGTVNIDIPDPLNNTPNNNPSTNANDAAAEGGELDIF